MADWIALAEDITSKVLAPNAAEVDRTGHIPNAHFAELAARGFYGFPGAGFTLEEAFEAGTALISGCLATGFVWAQHVGALRAVAASDNEELKAEYLPRMAAGEFRCPVSYAGTLAKPTLFLEETEGGYVLDGIAPFVSGWDYTQGLVATALLRGGDGDRLGTVLVTDRDARRLRAHPLPLIAADASHTVRLAVDALPIPAAHVVNIGTTTGFREVRMVADWINGALAFGVVRDCLRELERLDADPAPFRDRYEQLRARYTGAAGDLAAVHQLRAQAGLLAVHTATAAVVATGSRAVLAGATAERLTRAAQFVLVATTRDPIKQALTEALAAHAPD
ncbi:acyl-CoA dehydrogenase family protein [Nocardia sp. NPDC050435]|uniref:acyl-CoA dehydrogenase family protein n=1 Tax=Nocardia sp. NPDC050435 TaxID=3155040 RepID=UPI0033EA6319